MEFSSLKGKVLKNIHVNRDKQIILFVVSDEEIYMMHHDQECCESVVIEDICGELQWLIGEPILRAEERCMHSMRGEESQTYTFYEIATIKGAVTIRWWGSSNGYYSESVYFELLSPDAK